MANLSIKKGVSCVLIHAALSIALYCQRCGKIEIHDVSYFLSRNKTSMLKCSCNHIQATLVRDASNRFKLRIPCGVCENVHEHLIKLKEIKNFTICKIYCEKDYFELGYVGKRKYIEEILTFNKLAFEKTSCNEIPEKIEKQQLVLEVLNKVHDMVEQGNVICPCGKEEFRADIMGDNLILECMHCDSYHIISMRNESDLTFLNKMESINLKHASNYVRNIDLD